MPIFQLLPGLTGNFFYSLFLFFICSALSRTHVRRAWFSTNTCSSDAADAGSYSQSRNMFNVVRYEDSDRTAISGARPIQSAVAEHGGHQGK